MGWCRCSVENYYITPGDLSSQSELLLILYQTFHNFSRIKLHEKLYQIFELGIGYSNKITAAEVAWKLTWQTLKNCLLLNYF